MPRPSFSILTESTCADACWHAREEICRCSCGGRNHGCLLVEGAERPERSSRIDGSMMTLKAVGDYATLQDEARRIFRLGYELQIYGWMQKTPLFPAHVKAASARQIETWPELASYRGKTLHNMSALAPDETIQSPYLLYVEEKELARVIGLHASKNCRSRKRL